MRYLLLALSVMLVGCVSTRSIPQTGIDFQLDRCPPFLNCVSSESIIPLYQVAPVKLVAPLRRESWQAIQQTVLAQPGASLTQARFGYLRVTWHSALFRFPDFVELLLADDSNSLAVRSQSLFGLFDFGVNRARIERLREELIARGLAVR